MENFTDEHSSLLLTKEWLVKVDPSHSIPYLIKFGASSDNSYQVVLITDTKTVWAEVLTEKQVLRRWRDCNTSLPITASNNVVPQLYKLLSSAHTSGGLNDADFEIVDSKDADLALELDFENFKWRWDTYLLGPKTSAELISKHLIFPFISLTHISFNSADSVSELDGADLEKTVDQVCRIARRGLDTHVKQTMMRPKISSSLQRISALFNLSSELPSIKTEHNPPDLETEFKTLKLSLSNSNSEAEDQSTRATETIPVEIHQIEALESQVASSAKPNEDSSHNNADDSSVTESDSGDPEHDDLFSPMLRRENLNKPTTLDEDGASSLQKSKKSDSPMPGPSIINSDSETSPPQKRVRMKAVKPSTDSDSDSEEREKNPCVPPGGSRGGKSVGRGVRQPIKRGAKRF